MKIKMAHLNDQGIDFAVFGANARVGTDAARAELLAELTVKARLEGLKVDKSALQYGQGRQIRFYGTPDLVNYLASIGGVRHWTHQMDV